MRDDDMRNVIALIFLVVLMRNAMADYPPAYQYVNGPTTILAQPQPQQRCQCSIGGECICGVNCDCPPIAIAMPVQSNIGEGDRFTAIMQKAIGNEGAYLCLCVGQTDEDMAEQYEYCVENGIEFLAVPSGAILYQDSKKFRLGNSGIYYYKSDGKAWQKYMVVKPDSRTKVSQWEATTTVPMQTATIPMQWYGGSVGGTFSAGSCYT